SPITQRSTTASEPDGEAPMAGPTAKPASAVPGGVDTGTETFELRSCIDDQPTSGEDARWRWPATYSARTQRPATDPRCRRVAVHLAHGVDLCHSRKDLGRLLQHGGRNDDAEGLRRGPIHDEIELRGGLDGKVAGPGTLQDAVDVAGGPAEEVREARAVVHEPT